MKPSEEDSFSPEEPEKRSSVILWNPKMEKSKKPRVKDPITRQNCQWLIEKALEKIGKEEFGLVSGVDFTTEFVPELEDNYKLLRGRMGVLVLWAIMPTDKRFVPSLRVCLSLVKRLQAPKSIDLQARINARAEWCKKFQKQPIQTGNGDIAKVEEYRVVRITHRNGLISSHSAPATGVGSRNWRTLGILCREELARVIKLLEEREENE